MRTTREIALEKLNQDRVSRLQELLEKSYDAEAGYKKAMELVNSDIMGRILRERAAKRSQFANEIDLEIRKLNATPKESGSTTAALHRSWMDVKSLLPNTTDEAILDECVRGEEACVEDYKSVLREQTFEPDTTKLLSKQLHRIETTLKEIKQQRQIAEIMN